MGNPGFHESDTEGSGGIIKMKTRDNLPIKGCIKNPVILRKQYETVLGFWPASMEKVHIPTSLGDTFCIKSGDEVKPSMILIHGSLSNSASWMADIKILNEKYQTFCLDIPGDPGGSEDRRFSWEGPFFSQWIIECMDYLNIDKSAVGGLSLGGWASLRFAIDYPEKVSKLFLLAPAGLAPIKGLSVLKLFILSLMGKWGQEKILHMLFKGKEITQELRDFFEVTAKNCKPRFGNPPVFSDEELSSLKMPVVFIGGDNDVLVDTKRSLERLSRCVDSLTSIVLDEGHALVNLDDKVFKLLG